MPARLSHLGCWRDRKLPARATILESAEAAEVSSETGLHNIVQIDCESALQFADKNTYFQNMGLNAMDSAASRRSTIEKQALDVNKSGKRTF